MKNFVLSAMFSTFSLFYVGFIYAEAPQAVKIGALLHLTGEFAVQGVAFRQGIELAAAEINSAGGIQGQPLEVVFEDTQYKPLQSSTSARKIAQMDHVKATLISTVTEAKAAGAVLQREKIPTIVLWDSSPEVEAIGDYVFGIGPWAPNSGKRAATFATTSLHARSAVVVNSNTEWSLYVSSYFAAAFKAAGGTVLQQFALNPDENDFRTIIAKVRATSADVIYAPIDGNIIPFFQQLKQLKMTIPIITSDIVTDEYLTTEAKSFEGVYQTMTGDPNFPESIKMYAAYNKHFGKPISQAQFVAWGYDATKLIAQTGAAHGITREKIRDGLRTARNFQGASGVISMDEHGSAPRPTHVFRVQKGQFEMIEE